MAEPAAQPGREPMDGDDQRRVVVTITPTKVIAADLYA
jgi:hypothetical protein